MKPCMKVKTDMNNNPVNQKDLITQVPGATRRLGPTTFITMDAYPLDPEMVQVVFVNKELLEKLLGESLTEEQAEAFVKDNLLITLDPAAGIPDSTPVKVFVDRQDDPMNMSLNGNLGSGRAVYYGSCFNLKGIGRTALASSVDPNHSNGNLDLVSALWEMICANVLFTNLDTGTAPVLAVIDRNRQIEVPWREGLYPSGVVIRVDCSGELDRPTHLFQCQEAVAGDRLRNIAGRLGCQDAEKFIERILHGCWSAGNISLEGHLIDYDTVFAVRGRAPQWSYRPNWLSNFFGLEGAGQKKILKAIADHPINGEAVSYRELCHFFDAARKSQLERRFIDLTGFDQIAAKESAPITQSALSALVDLFEMLSKKMFPDFKATAPWDEHNSRLSVYDLAGFMRLYPILRKSGHLDKKILTEMIRNPVGLNVETLVSGMPDSIRRSMTRDFVVSSEDQLIELDRLALEFIEEYEKLLAAIEAKFPEAMGRLAMRSYVINEERTYMNCRPGNDTLVALIQNWKSGKINARRFSELLNLLIKANDRIPRLDEGGCCIADMRLFLNGYTANLVSAEDVFQPCLTMFSESEFSEISNAESWELSIGSSTRPCKVASAAGRMRIIGPRFPLKLLTSGIIEPVFTNRGVVFQLQSIEREKA